MFAPKLPYCRQCQSSRVTLLGRIPQSSRFAGQTLNPAWDGGSLYLCQQCHLGFRHPVRSDQEYEALYDSAPDSVWVSTELRPDQQRVRSAIRSRHAQGKVLDVGCYDGSFLRALVPQFQCFGIEASAAARRAAEANGVSVLAPHIRDLADVEQLFDVVSAIDVIEHVVQPFLFLQTLVARTKPGGDVMISTGTLDALAWQQAGGAYWYSAIPEHISFIKQAWLTAAAKQLNLELVHTETFFYWDDNPGDRQRMQSEFHPVVRRSRRKQALLRMLPGRLGKLAPRTIFGRPGIFADHIVAVFKTPT